MDNFLEISREMAALKDQTGFAPKVKKLALQARAAITFLRLFLMSPKRHELPADVRLVPSW
jgi:hypothetical protein